MAVCHHSRLTTRNVTGPFPGSRETFNTYTPPDQADHTKCNRSHALVKPVTAVRHHNRLTTRMKQVHCPGSRETSNTYIPLDQTDHTKCNRSHALVKPVTAVRHHSRLNTRKKQVPCPGSRETSNTCTPPDQADHTKCNNRSHAQGSPVCCSASSRQHRDGMAAPARPVPCGSRRRSLSDWLASRHCNLGGKCRVS